jgi:hypothetical protein
MGNGTMMSRLLATALSLTMTALLCGGCGGSVVEVPPDNPHAPVLSNVSVTPGTIMAESRLDISLDYADTAGDVLIVHFRDNQSGTRYENQTEVDPDGKTVTNLFPGTSGNVNVFIPSFTGRQVGVHTISVWLEDAYGSYSNTIEVNVTVYL